MWVPRSMGSLSRGPDAPRDSPIPLVPFGWCSFVGAVLPMACRRHTQIHPQGRAPCELVSRWRPSAKVATCPARVTPIDVGLPPTRAHAACAFFVLHVGHGIKVATFTEGRHFHLVRPAPAFVATLFVDCVFSWRSSPRVATSRALTGRDGSLLIMPCMFYNVSFGAIAGEWGWTHTRQLSQPFGSVRTNTNKHDLHFFVRASLQTSRHG